MLPETEAPPREAAASECMSCGSDSLEDTPGRAGFQLAPELRTYQIEVIAAVRRAIEAGERRIMLVAPTGSGKTVIASAIVRDAVANVQRVLFFSHRREITSQSVNKLFDQGIDAGIIQAGWEPRPQEPVQVASIQTLSARGLLPRVDLVIVDEAHHAAAGSYRKLLEKYPVAIVIGLTATPCRKDGRGLGDIFTTLIQCPQVTELVKLGFLVPTVVYAPADRIDLSGIRTQAGDYVGDQLAERMNTAKLVGDIITHWHRHAGARKTIVFATDVAHSVHLRDEFRRSGAKAEHIDGKTPKDEREAILGKLARSEIQIVTNCMVLTEGLDCPDIECIVLARPTRSMGLYRQMCGRGLRPATGKTDLLILDHAGAVYAHGFFDEPVTWTLDTSKKAINKKQEAAAANTADDPDMNVGVHGWRLCECSKRGALRRAGERCRSCGWLPQRPPKRVEFMEGDLGRVDRSRTASAHSYTAQEKSAWHAMLTYIARERGHKPGSVYWKYKEKFGHEPPRGISVMPMPPSAEVRSWVRSRQIAYAKSMQRGGP